MTRDEAEEVLDLAERSDHPVQLSEAAEVLGYDSPRGVAKRISCAWTYFENNGEQRSAAIFHSHLSFFEPLKFFMQQWGTEVVLRPLA